MFVPKWKLKRELRRFVQQAFQLPWLFISPIYRRRHDSIKSSQLRIMAGDIQKSSEIAVFLIFQPKGLLNSALHTLRHLQSQGVATLVVSNAPLSSDDREKLRPFVWKLMERPNFGYDFGGYRDGILYLLENGIRPSRLHVLNDSAWFPLRENCDLLDEARDSEADLFGFVLNTRMRLDRRQHVQSYFFSFSGKLFRTQDFEQHWRKLFLTNNKDLVVRRCEIPMTDAFRKLGYSVAFRHTYTDGAEALKALDNDTLRRAIAYQARVDTRNSKILNRHLQNQPLDDVWRNRIYQDIDAGVFEKYFMINHPAVLVDVLKSPFLKKDRQEIYQLQRDELIRGQHDTEFAPVIRDEILQWDPRPPSGRSFVPVKKSDPALT